MIDIENFKSRIFSDNHSFNDLALEAFQYQFEFNVTYKKYCKYLKKEPRNIVDWQQIPCLPIEFFKSQKIISGNWSEEKTFLSSGTTGQARSKHFVRDINYYHLVSQSIFQDYFGDLSKLNIYAILPSYQEMGDSSLLSMVDFFIKNSKESSGYFLENQELPLSNGQEIIFGVTYALLDGNITHPNFNKCIIMDTGGMKGRKKEITRNEVIELLKLKYEQIDIWSEYGMTEITSQAYGKNGALCFPKWARVIIRDINDPFKQQAPNQSGGINIIDLANIETCCFIETKDIGIMRENGHFEVLGRFDNSDIRGCSLLV
jgi:hypothetical protein